MPHDEISTPVSRREAIQRVTLLVGGALVVAPAVMAACGGEAARGTTSVLSHRDRALVEAIADTLLPTTAASPGARAAGAGAGIDLLLTDCRDADVQRRVVRGLEELRALSRARSGGDFAALAPEARERLLREVDAEAQRAGDGHWFALVRGLAEEAYFRSEIGMTKALRWVPVPGRWVGCVPLRPGQPAWA